MATKKDEMSVLPRPTDIDPEWAEKIAKAREARENKSARPKKPGGFYVPRSICRTK